MDNIFIEILNNDNITDLEYIKSNLEKTFNCTWNSVQLEQELLNENNTFIIAKGIANSMIIGFICIKQILDEVEILNICVDKNYRNMKIGFKLLDFALKLAKKNNCVLANLEVNINNAFAIKLYNSLNFEIVTVRKQYYLNKNSNTKEDAYIMSKKI